ncbi:MAG: TetR/AcrR family transcriptional regulator [Methanobacteriaceae archaeon]
MKEKTTKEKIFSASIKLFSEKGFNTVTVREIANHVGIKESSIYNHYPSKESILDSILDYFICEMESESIPENQINTLIEENPKLFYKIGSDIFEEKMKNPEIIKIWRLVLIEMYHNPRIKEFFLKKLIEGPISFWSDVFSIMIEKKLIKSIDPERIAKEYFAYAIYLLIENFVLKTPDDDEKSLEIIFKDMNQHTEFILENIKLKDF